MARHVCPSSHAWEEYSNDDGGSDEIDSPHLALSGVTVRSRDDIHLAEYRDAARARHDSSRIALIICLVDDK